MQPDATSPDGYIIAQSKTGDIPYGKRNSDYSGCGWIAAFNYIKVMGGNPNATTLSQKLGAEGWFKGVMGTGPRRLRRTLAALGWPTNTAFGRKKAIALARDAQAGILMYRHRGVGLHYVAFARQPNGQLRFFNAVDGAPAHLTSFPDFLNTHARRFPLWLMTAPGGPNRG